MLQEEALKEMEARRRMRATIVPTIVEAVKQVLRSMGEPVTLFGERPVSHRPLHPENDVRTILELYY